MGSAAKVLSLWNAWHQYRDSDSWLTASKQIITTATWQPPVILLTHIQGYMYIINMHTVMTYCQTGLHRLQPVLWIFFLLRPCCLDFCLDAILGPVSYTWRHNTKTQALTQIYIYIYIQPKRYALTHCKSLVFINSALCRAMEEKPLNIFFRNSVFFIVVLKPLIMYTLV